MIFAKKMGIQAIAGPNFFFLMSIPSQLSERCGGIWNSSNPTLDSYLVVSEYPY